MSVPLNTLVSSLRKNPYFGQPHQGESLPEFADRMVFVHYLRFGFIPDEIKTFQLLAHQTGRIASLKAALREVFTGARRWSTKFDPDEPRIPAGEPGAGEWTNSDGESDSASEDGAASLEKTLEKLRSDASSTSRGWCARAVREALDAGGITVLPPAARAGSSAPSAADYGPSFERAGANIVASESRISGPTVYPPKNYTPRAGDVIVFERFPGHPDGHTAMFDEKRWISDFRQYSPWPNQTAARAYGPGYKIYRFPQFSR